MTNNNVLIQKDLHHFFSRLLSLDSQVKQSLHLRLEMDQRVWATQFRQSIMATIGKELLCIHFRMQNIQMTKKHEKYALKQKISFNNNEESSIETVVIEDLKNHVDPLTLKQGSADWHWARKFSATSSQFHDTFKASFCKFW